MSERVFVGNLSYSLTEGELRAAFEENGFKVAEVAIVNDRETGQPRGFGFVTLVEEGSAKKAIQLMDGTLLARRPLRVSEAHERERRGGGPNRGAPPPQSDFRRGGGGGGGGRDDRGGRRRRDRDEDRW